MGTRYEMEIVFKNPPAPSRPPAGFAPTPPPPAATSSPSPTSANASATSPPAATPGPTPSATSSPGGGGGFPSSFNSSVYTNSTPILWMVPLTYTVQQASFKGQPMQTALFAVRGNKFGAACVMRCVASSRGLRRYTAAQTLP